MSKLFVIASKEECYDLGGGVRRKILGYDDHLMMVCVDFEKDAIGSLHSHKHRQVTYVAKGVFEVEIAGEKEILKEGDSFFVPSDATHGVRALEAGRLIDVFTPSRNDFLKQQ